MNETDLLYAFMKRVPFEIPTVRIFRRHIIAAKTEIEGREVWQRSGTKGQADAWALVVGGRHIEIETKAARGTMLTEQKRWRAWCERHRVPYLILRARRGEDSEETVNRWAAELRAVVEST